MTVTCDKCGEELVGAVNRCWKCGKAFAKVEGDLQPPVRRAPVLAAYLMPVLPADDAEAVIVAEAADTSSPAATGTNPWIERARQADHYHLAVAALALIACWISVYSVFGVPLGIAAIALSIRGIRQRGTKTAWASFLLSVAALLCLLVRLVAFLFNWAFGLNLFITLFG